MHHAGLLPIIKEVVEMLFGKSLIKVIKAERNIADSSCATGTSSKGGAVQSHERCAGTHKRCCAGRGGYRLTLSTRR